MPTESKLAEPGFDLNTPDGRRGYINNLLKTELKRHDFACSIIGANQRPKQSFVNGSYWAERCPLRRAAPGWLLSVARGGIHHRED